MTALEHFVPDGQTDGQTDRVTPWAPVGAKKSPEVKLRSQLSHTLYHLFVATLYFGLFEY